MHWQLSILESGQYFTEFMAMLQTVKDEGCTVNL